MANETQNYFLKKPSKTEFYNVEVQNSNMEIIDTNLKSVSDKATNAENDLPSLFQGVRNLMVVGGGQLNWGTTANVFAWSKDIFIYPLGSKLLYKGLEIKALKIVPSNVTLAANGDCAFLTIPTAYSDTTNKVVTATLSVGQFSAISGNDKLVIAIRDVDSCLQMREGWIPYGTVVAAGGKRDTYVENIFTAANDFILGNGNKSFIKRTLAETKTILGINGATETATGVVELATSAEVTAGTDTIRAVTPAGLKVELDKKANLASPALAGTPTAPTATAGTNNTQIATTAFVAALGALKEDKSNKGVANGYAGLDANGKVPLSQMNDSIIGQVEYKGLWNASTNSPTLATTPAEKGIYYVVSVAGTQFSKDFAIGDWIISNGTTWDKVDNTDAVSSVNGQTGVVNITSVTGNAGTATKLATARNIAITGDLTGNANFDGSANVSIAGTLANSGVTAGTYTKVTVDSKGRVTSATQMEMIDIPTSSYKKSCRVATTVNITLSGTQTIDGIAVVVGDRVLVKNQTTASQNGIYNANTGTWTRAVDADLNTEICSAVTNIDEGSTNGGKAFTNNFKATDTLGTTAMNWFEIATTSSNVASATQLANARTIGTMTGDVTSAGSSFNGTGNNTNVTTIANNAVNNAKLAAMPAMTIKGNNTAGTADPKDLTKAEIQALIQDSNNRMVSDAQIAGWSAAGAGTTLVDITTPTGTYNIPTGLGIGSKIRIRKINSTQGTVSINAQGSEKITPALLTTVTLNSDGDFWLLEKVSATRWDLVEGYETGSNANGEYTRYADGTQECEAWININLNMIAGGTSTQYTWAFPKEFLAVLSVGALGLPSISSDFYGTTCFAALNTGACIFNFRNGSTSAQAITSAVFSAKGRWY